MTLHENVTIAELTEFCLLCYEYGERCKRVHVDKLTLKRIKAISPAARATSKHLGITFLKQRD